VGLPTVDELTAKYGDDTVDDENCLGAFFSNRTTLPYSLKDAVERVEACALCSRLFYVNKSKKIHTLIYRQ
jgi:hypothetical protein